MADLNRLIDEVLSMAKDSQNLRKKKQKDDESSAVNQSWDDTPAGQAYWKDIRGRNTDMEKQGLVNQGALSLARENNAGSMARARLEAETATNLANLAARVENQKTTNDFNIRKYESDQTKKESGLGKEHIAGLTAIIGDMNAPDEDRAMARQLLLGGFRTNKDQPQVGGGPPQGSSREFDMEVPQVRTPKKPAITMPTLQIRQEEKVIPAKPIVRTPSYADRPSAMGLTFSPFRNQKEIAEAVPKAKAYFAEQSKIANISNSDEERRKRRERLQGWI